MNIGAIRLFTLRAMQVVSIEMITATFLSTNFGIKLSLWVYLIGTLILVSYVVVDVIYIYPQEQEYALKRNQELYDMVKKSRGAKK
jgi:hypothetical protein